MKQLWLLGIFCMCLASAKAPDPQIPGSTLRKMKDIAEAARMKYIEGKGLNEGLPLTKADENTSINKAPVSARFTISKIAKTGTGIKLTIVSENGDPINDVTMVGLGIVTGNNNDDFVGDYYQDSSTSDFSSPSEVEFTYDISTLEENDLTLFAVTGRTATDEVVAAGSVSYNAINITPSRLDRVGADNDGDVAIRLAYPQSFVAGIIVNVGTGDLCACTVYPCYCVGLSKSDTVAEVCSEVTSLEPSSVIFMLCDSTVKLNDVFGELTVNAASLTYTALTEADLEIDTNYGGFPNTVEIVYYESKEKTGIGSISCTPSKELCTSVITGIKETDIDNRILVVKKDIGGVTGSAINSFEDYKLKLSQISAQTLEARWTTAVLENFEISVDGALTGNVVNEKTSCIAYLTSLQSSNPLIISIKKTSDTLGANVVGVTKQLDSTTVTELAIAKILKTQPTELQTCVTAASDVTGINTMNLAFLINDGSPGIQYVYQIPHTTAISTGAETCIDFTVVAEALEGTKYTVIITAHNEVNEPIAAGEVSFTLKDVTLALDRVGAAAGDQSSALRIQTDTDITVNDNECLAADGICYLLASEAPTTDTVELCYEASLKTKLCDGGKKANQFTEIASVETVQLTYDISNAKSLAVTATFLETSTKMEIIIHADTTAIPKLECDLTGSKAIKSCSTGIFTDDDPDNPFSILKVALDGGSGIVLESHTALFENYATTVQQLTADLIEVRWSALTETTYLISLDKLVNGAYDRVTVSCGDTNVGKCKAYFMMLLPEQYEASVQLNDNGGQNIVAGTVLMASIVNANLKITSMALEDLGDTMLATVCFNHSSSSLNFAELTLIDRLGNFLSSQAFSSEDEFCIGNLTIAMDFSTSTPIRILVAADNSIYGDAELYLLDPNTQNSIAHVSVKQVGVTTLRANWVNLNDASGYVITTNGNQNEHEACDHRQQCGWYIEFSPTATSPVAITITEIGDIVQTLSFDVAITKDITPITISSISMRWDDRVQVCFIAPAEVSTYELGLQVSNELLQSTQSPQLVSGDNGTSCLVSEKTVEVGAYIELWSLVSAFGASGNLLASGSKVLKSIILSASRSVYGAVMDSTFLTTWHLLDNIKDIDHIKVTLLALESQGTRVIDTVNVTAAATSHDFGIQPEGKYSICVVAVKGGITSEEICSDIIRVHNTAVEVPLVRATSPKTTSENSVLVTWEPPQEDVSGFFISWNKVPVLLSLRESIKDGYRPRAKDGAIHPLDLMNFAKASSRATGTGFTIVASSETSFEVQDLESNQNYITCVFSVKDDVVGTQNCSDIDLADYEPLENPTNLIYENGDLTWTGDELAMHRVECQSRTDKRLSIFKEINGTKCQLELEPGEWDIEVRAFTDLSFSEATRITNTVKGLVVTAKQTEQTSLVVSWYEQNFVAPAVPDMTMPLYEVLLQRNGDTIAGPVPVYCSGSLIDCHREFQNLTVSFTDTVKVTVQPRTTTTSNKTSEFTFDEITGITMLTKNVRSSDEVEVTWEEVPQAKKYLYTIYDTEVLNNTIEQGYIPETTKTLTMPNITGYWLTVQGCTDEQHCGNLAIIPLNQGSGNTNDNKTTIIIAATISSVVGVGLILVIVAVVMRKKNRRGGKGESGKEGNEPKYDKWGARTLGQPKEKRGSPEDLPRSPSSRQNYGIPSTFNVHS